MVNTVSERNGVEVLVRCFRDRPVKLLLRESSGEMAELENPATGGTVCFPADLIYKLDGKIYDELCSAFSRGDQSLLMALWGKSQPCF